MVKISDALLVFSKEIAWKSVKPNKYISISAFGQSSTFTSDGRPIDLNKNPLGADAANIASAYGTHIKSQNTKLKIFLNLLNSEHPTIILNDFIHIVKQSPIVLPDRMFLCTRALYYGYQGDFAASLYLLAPQIENIVRFDLKRHNLLTTHQKNSMDQDRDETSLSSHMEKTEIKQILNDDIAFEINTLFCVKGLPNLRNNVAYALLDDEQSQGNSAVYAWYIFLKLIFSEIDKCGKIPFFIYKS